jgi:hypothetical protein
MKRLVLAVLFFTSAQLIGQNDNFPYIRYDKGLRYQTSVRRFEDKGNICYVAENITYSGTSISISCVKAAQ